MNPIKLRRWHKWLGLILGIQLLVWCVSGFYMVSLDLDFIHGDSLVKDLAMHLPGSRPIVPLAELLPSGVVVTNIRLRALPDEESAIYEIETRDGLVRIDAHTGRRLGPINESRVRALASHYYAGSGIVKQVQLLTDRLPVEARGHELPIWRVDFDDWLETSFYLDVATGTLVARRHKFWRLFDTMWMLHIMDYGYNRHDVNNTLLRVVSIAGIAVGITGVWLLFHSFRRRAAIGR
jgi:hypothetical protein